MPNLEDGYKITEIGEDDFDSIAECWEDKAMRKYYPIPAEYDNPSMCLSYYEDRVFMNRSRGDTMLLKLVKQNAEDTVLGFAACLQTDKSKRDPINKDIEYDIFDEEHPGTDCKYLPHLYFLMFVIREGYWEGNLARELLVEAIAQSREEGDARTLCTRIDDPAAPIRLLCDASFVELHYLRIADSSDARNNAEEGKPQKPNECEQVNPNDDRCRPK